MAAAPYTPRNGLGLSPKSVITQGVAVSSLFPSFPEMMLMVPYTLSLAQAGQAQSLEGGPRLARPSFKGTPAFPEMGVMGKGGSSHPWAFPAEAHRAWEPEFPRKKELEWKSSHESLLPPQPVSPSADEGKPVPVPWGL